MTKCAKILPRLTAYLDGELADADGSFIRGHLRECAACRQTARDEAALRDGLRVLTPVDPPASLWAGVQAQLAAAEVADARKPWWRRAMTRWIPTVPAMRQVAAGVALAAAVTLGLSWRARQPDETTSPAPTARQPADVPRAPSVALPPAGDVTAELIAEPARTTASYDLVVEELMTLAQEARRGWSDSRRAAFDGEVAGLREAIARAAQGRPQQHAHRALIRFLQGAVIRDDMVLASGGAR
jgi:anti-sigma factor RsiW